MYVQNQLILLSILINVIWHIEIITYLKLHEDTRSPN